MKKAKKSKDKRLQKIEIYEEIGCTEKISSVEDLLCNEVESGCILEGEQIDDKNIISRVKLF